VKRYLGLWVELLRLSWRTVPRLTAGLLASNALIVAASVSIALTLRYAVNATIDGAATTAVACAAGAAFAYATTYVLNQVSDSFFIVALERVALGVIMPATYRDLVGLEGLEHLERSDFLDRVTVVEGSAWGIMAGFWSSIGVAFSVVQLAVSLVLLGTVDPWLLLLLGFAAAPLWFDQRGQRAVKRAEIDTAEVFRLQRHLFDLGTDAAAGKDIRVARAGAEVARRQAEAWQEAMTGRFRAQLSAALWKAGGWTLFTVGFTAGLLLVAYRTTHGHGSAGDLVLAITVATSLRQSVHDAVSRGTQSAMAGRLIEPYLWLREYLAADRAQSHGSAPTPASLRDGITFDQVTYTYPGTDRKALDGFSAHLPAGSVVAIVGEYGSGKTTLIKLLHKFYRPDSGAIRIDGTDLADLDTARWRARSSAAFQDFGRFETVFAETVGLGDLPRIGDRERIARAVHDADADSLVARLPDGMDTQLGRKLGGVDLSEGQWQRTALARACMREDPLLFVLDEPTASLDAPSEHAIFEHYMRRARELAAASGAITVIISHRFSTVAGADLILVMDQGRLAEAGTHEELLAGGGPYAELYGITSAAYADAEV
jgi:ABC-type multidrug transport system fused ATPase/permease subunit